MVGGRHLYPTFLTRRMFLEMAKEGVYLVRRGRSKPAALKLAQEPLLDDLKQLKKAVGSSGALRVATHVSDTCIETCKLFAQSFLRALPHVSFAIGSL